MQNKHVKVNLFYVMLYHYISQSALGTGHRAATGRSTQNTQHSTATVCSRWERATLWVAAWPVATPPPTPPTTCPIGTRATRGSPRLLYRFGREEKAAPHCEGNLANSASSSVQSALSLVVCADSS
jgi:hypothetical protein